MDKYLVKRFIVVSAFLVGAGGFCLFQYKNKPKPQAVETVTFPDKPSQKLEKRPQLRFAEPF